MCVDIFWNERWIWYQCQPIYVTVQYSPRCIILCVLSLHLLAGGSSPMKGALEKFGFTGCKDSDLEPVFTYLEFCLKQVRCLSFLPASHGR